jgi:hypothetical protein
VEELHHVVRIDVQTIERRYVYFATMAERSQESSEKVQELLGQSCDR